MVDDLMTAVKKSEKSDIDRLSFEEALKELESIVQTLESGQSSLDGAITSYERGAALKKRCEMLLNEAKLKVENINFTDTDANAADAANS